MRNKKGKLGIAPMTYFLIGSGVGDSNQRPSDPKALNFNQRLCNIFYVELNLLFLPQKVVLDTIQLPISMGIFSVR